MGREKRAEEALILLRSRLCNPNFIFTSLSDSPDSNYSKLKFIVSSSVTEVLELVIEDLLKEYPDMILVIKLNGLLHSDDNCALKVQIHSHAKNMKNVECYLIVTSSSSGREIARQLCVEHQLLFSKMASFDDNTQFMIAMLRECGLVHKTVIFVLDEFDLFAQGKQRLLYSLLDAMQSVTSQAIVIGVSCRLDADQLLEKRVRSRFSHRKLLFLPPSKEDLQRLLKHILVLPTDSSLPHDYVDAVVDFANNFIQDTSGCREMIMFCGKSKMHTGLSQNERTFQGGPRLVPQKWAVKASVSGSPPGLYSAKIFELTPQNVDMVLEDVRPYLISDGGNVDVVSVADGVISLKLQGACGSCPSSTTTMKMGIERVLKEKFGDAVKDIRQVYDDDHTSETTVEAVNGHLDILRPAIKNYGMYWFLFSAVSHMDLDFGFLSLENFKAALSSIQRQPKVECLKDCSVLELYILVCMRRLEVKEQESYNFNSAFEHLLERELISFMDNRGHNQSVEFRPVKLLISYHELYQGLKSYRSCPLKGFIDGVTSPTRHWLVPQICLGDFKIRDSLTNLVLT
ncbi:unnamed protein product [Camellia sinensis]